jgi:hypothetical protein
MIGSTSGSQGDVGRALEEEMRASLVNGKLPCAVAFKIARKLKVTPRQVGDAANRLNIKISSCQLGCFP